MKPTAFLPPVPSGALRLWLAILLLGCCLHASAALRNFPEHPQPVTDLTGSLSSSQQQALTRQLLALEQQKGSQLAVLIVPTTGAESIEQFSMRVVEQWKLGRKGVDDGVLLLLAKDDQRLRIEVGYGLEGTLTDAAARRIIDEHMLPQLRDGDVHGAMQAGIGQITPLIEGEPLTRSVKSWLSQLWDEISIEQVILMTLMAGLVAETLGRRLPRVLCGLLCALLNAGAFWLLTSSQPMAQLAAAIGLIIGLLSSRNGTLGASGDNTDYDSSSSHGSRSDSGSHHSHDSRAGSSFESSSSGDFGGGGASGGD